MKDVRDEPKLIGTINLDTEDFNSIGECKVYVYSNERITPHFHIISNNGDECCICIYKPLYFNHCDNKNIRLNVKQRKKLNEWLDIPCKAIEKLSNWECIDFAWKIGNRDGIFPHKQQSKPNYNYLTGMEK